MQLKYKVIFLFIVILFSLIPFSLFAQKGETIYIKFDFPSNKYLDENFIEKKIIEDKIIFSKGLETMGVINSFIYDPQKHKKTRLHKCKLCSIQFSSLEQISQKAQKYGYTKDPSRAFEKIYLVEIANNGEITMYEVGWERRYFIE